MPYRVALFVRKDSDIHSIKDLKGKRVGSGFHAVKDNRQDNRSLPCKC